MLKTCCSNSRSHSHSRRHKKIPKKPHGRPGEPGRSHDTSGVLRRSPTPHTRPQQAPRRPKEAQPVLFFEKSLLEASQHARHFLEKSMPQVSHLFSKEICVPGFALLSFFENSAPQAPHPDIFLEKSPPQALHTRLFPNKSKLLLMEFTCAMDY